MKKHRFVLHPFIFGLLPVLVICANNFDLVPPRHTIVPALVLAVFAGLLLLFANLFFDNRNKAALFVSAFLIVFFAHRDIFLFLQAQGVVTKVRYLFVAYAVAFVGLYFALRRIKNNLSAVTKVVNFIAVLLLLFNVGSIALQAFGEKKNNRNPTADVQQFSAPYKPDVYHFVLDGYAREDVLQRIHGYDNKPFLDELRKRGFYVADSSTSNYTHTIASISSMLNFRYLDKPDVRRMYEGIQRNETFAIFEKLGYTTVSFPTGFKWSDIPNVDVHQTVGYISELGVRLVSITPLSALPFNRNLYVDAKRRLVLNPYKNMASLLALPSPKFVYVHTVSPHPPFIFGPNGEELLPEGNLWADNEWALVSKQSSGYNDQVTFVNKLVLAAVDSILARSAHPPVIILNGDHGSKMTSNYLSFEGNDFAEECSNLCAVYFPGGKNGALYPSVSPVNYYRLVFNEYFGASYPLLPDRSFFYPQKVDAGFTDITHLVRGVPATP